MTSDSDAILARLVDEQLSAVTFVQDYLQLSFDALRLTVNVWPVVGTDAGETRFGEERYRNELCAFIGQPVTRAVELGGAIEIAFAIGTLRIDLLAESAAERLIFEDTVTKEWAYW